MTFKGEQYRLQADYFARTAALSSHLLSSGLQFNEGNEHLNLNPDLLALFRAKADVTWHTELRHGASSQACCLNFLMPLSRQERLLTSLVEGAIGVRPIRMLPASKDSDSLVDFEFIGRANYLNEWPKAGKPSRGANATSIDAILRYVAPGGAEEALLIEWKYTENDLGPLSNKAPAVSRGERTYGNATRSARYGTIFEASALFRPSAGLELEDFFYHPFYQLLRQQLFAAAMEADPEDPARRVRLVHVAPASNTQVGRVPSGTKLSRLASAGQTAFELFEALLANSDSFRHVTTEALFGPLLGDPFAPPAWADYIRARYDFVSGDRSIDA